MTWLPNDDEFLDAKGVAVLREAITTTLARPHTLAELMTLMTLISRIPPGVYLGATPHEPLEEIDEEKAN